MVLKNNDPTAEHPNGVSINRIIDEIISKTEIMSNEALCQARDPSKKERSGFASNVKSTGDVLKNM